MPVAIRLPLTAALVAVLPAILPGCRPQPASNVAGSPDGEPEACVLEATYEFGWVGGLTPVRDWSRLEPPDAYQLTRSFLFEREGASCTTTIPACGAPDRIDVGDVRDALGHGDVAGAWTAWADGEPEAYGRDLRPMDGAVWVIRRVPDSGQTAGIVVGMPCLDDASCRPILPALGDLRDLLGALGDQQIALPACTDSLGR